MDGREGPQGKDERVANERRDRETKRQFNQWKRG